MKPWNKQQEKRIFWDAGLNNEVVKVQSLKEALRNCGGMRIDELVRTVAKGLAMVMDDLDKTQEQNTIVAQDAIIDED